MISFFSSNKPPFKVIKTLDSENYDSESLSEKNEKLLDEIIYILNDILLIHFIFLKYFRKNSQKKFPSSKNHKLKVACELLIYHWTIITHYFNEYNVSRSIGISLYISLTSSMSKKLDFNNLYWSNIDELILDRHDAYIEHLNEMRDTRNFHSSMERLLDYLIHEPFIKKEHELHSLMNLPNLDIQGQVLFNKYYTETIINTEKTIVKTIENHLS